MTILAQSPSIRQGAWLTVSEAATMLAVSPSSIRNLCRAGELTWKTTFGGHRRISTESVNRYLGYDPGDAGELEGKNIIIIYLRVSSDQQRRDGNLSRQKERMIEWAKTTFNVNDDRLTIIQDVASAFGNRPGLQKVVDAIIDGKCSHVVYEFSDRLSRTSSEKRLLEHLANRFGVQLVAAKETIEAEEKSYFVSELVDYVTVVANKISGRKGGETVRMEVSADARSRIIDLYRQGLNQQQTLAKVQSEGFRCEKTGKLISMHCVRETLRNAESIQPVAGDGSPGLLATFIADRCQLGGKVNASTFYDAYRRFAQRRGLTIGNKWTVTLALKRMGHSSREGVYHGISLV